MKEFRDKVAVVTGAASGIGFGLAERCAQEGMKVVLAGINQDNLVQAQEALLPIGATTLCVQADIANHEDIKALAQKTLDAFGAVHLLVNNAGVGADGPVWATTLANWQWVINVNLWSVIGASAPRALGRARANAAGCGSGHLAPGGRRPDLSCAAGGPLLHSHASRVE